MKPRVVLLGLILAAVLGTAAGCRPASPTGSIIQADPAPFAGDPQPPPPTPRSGAPVTAFAILRPVREGDTVVHGSGPAGVPVLLVDVTFMGQNLAETVIGPDGTFELTLQPLEKNHRIGLMLGDLAGTAWGEGSFRDPGYNGKEAMQVPQVGFLYDTVLVEAR